MGRPARPGEVQNLMLLAFPEPGRVSLPVSALAAGPSAAETDVMLSARYAGPVPADTPALSDDFAPVERYTLMLLRR